MKLLDGKATAIAIKQELAQAVKDRKAAGKKIPHLAAILVGTDGGSMTYVAAKVKACEECGFESTLIRYDDSVSEETLLRRVQQLNEDTSIDGFIVQLPLPAHIDEMKVTLAIDPKKDVFTVVGIGDMSGDVFGNGMLLSDKIKLVAAFNHMHIFIDPNHSSYSNLRTYVNEACVNN